MADSTPKAASAGSFGSRMMSRTTLPYLVAAVLVSAVMAWYFFVFVPSQLDYFVGLRFRTSRSRARRSRARRKTSPGR